MAVELQPLVLESTLTMQKLLEAENHEARCVLLKHFVDAERKRLATKKSLTGLFSEKGAGMESIPKEERLGPQAMKGDKGEKSDGNSSKSIFTDEEDAWG